MFTEVKSSPADEQALNTTKSETGKMPVQPEKKREVHPGDLSTLDLSL